MLTQITVQGFKSLQDVRNLALGQVNVFIGANGSGKTNLLEAIGLLGAAARGPVDDEALQRRGMRLGTFKSSFKTTGAAERINLCAVWSKKSITIQYQIEFSKTDAHQQPWQPGGGFEPIHAGDNELAAKEYGIGPSTPRDRVSIQFRSALSEYAIFSPNTSVLRGTKTDSQRLPVGLAGGRLPEAVDELLDAEQGIFGALDLDELLQLLDWVDQIAVVPPSRELIPPSVPTMRNVIRFTDRWMATGRNQLSAYDASEGALYVLFALVLALHPKSPRLFAIENLDQAMHPRLARATIRLFCQQMLKLTKKRQVLLTTITPLF